jgi:hypothetical protein
VSLAPDQLHPRIAGYSVIDCEIKNRDILYLLVREDYTQRPGWHDSMQAPGEGRLAKRLLGLGVKSLDAPKMSVTHLTGLGQSMCGVAFAPEEKVVVLDSSTRGWSPAAGSSGFEGPIPPAREGGIHRGGLTRLKSFGSQLLACNSARQVFVRTAPGAWSLVGDAMPEPAEHTISFADFDGFGPDELYAVGDPGDVWHLSGGTWTRLKFPSDWGLSAVCCAGDGNVYVAAGKHLFRRQGSEWAMLASQAQTALPIKDLVWHENTLWATGNHGVWVLKNDCLVDADVPADIRSCAGNLAVRDGAMLLAGDGGAAMHWDGQWTLLFHDHAVRQWLASHRDEVWTPPK